MAVSAFFFTSSIGSIPGEPFHPHNFLESHVKPRIAHRAFYSGLHLNKYDHICSILSLLYCREHFWDDLFGVPGLQLRNSREILWTNVPARSTAVRRRLPLVREKQYHKACILINKSK